MVRFALCGAGRIGLIHAKNILEHPRAELSFVLDVDRSAAERVAGPARAQVVGTLAEALPAVDAVLIASPTSTHVPLIEAALEVGRAVFCEKPIDIDGHRTRTVVEKIEARDLPFFVGFNRRFDPSFARLKEALVEGEIGALELLSITSRDSSPPPPGYIAGSGGLFRDMMIHDFDMARWLLGGDPVEVHAVAANLVDPAIGAAGDVDTAVVLLRAQSGAIVQISNSRRAVYGYDQRIEAFGEKGMLLAENQAESTLVRYLERGVIAERPMSFFLERYAAAYKAELDHFIREIEGGDPVFLTSARDGERALALAEAALASLTSGRPVRFGS